MDRNFNDHVSRDKIKISLRHVKKLSIKKKKKKALVSGLNIQITLELFKKSRKKVPNLTKLVSGNIVLCGLSSINTLENEFSH